MRRSTRRILFYTFAIIFLIAGPLLVAYSLGYTLNLSTATFESTGGVFIKSGAARLAVFLDGAFVKETGFITGSTLLTDVTPGAHLVRLEKPGFRPWSKTVAVEPNAVTELRDVLLVPHQIAAATSTAAELALIRATSTPAEALAIDRTGSLVAGRGAQAKKIAENVHSFAAAGDAVYFVGQSGFLARYGSASGELATIGRPGFFLDSKSLRFIPGAGVLAIIDSSGGLFLYEEASGTVAPITSGVKEISFDGEEQKLLITKEQSIEILWTKPNDYQPFQPKGTLETVITETAPIREARWYYATDAHAVYRTRQGVFLVETDTRGGGNVAQLLDGPVDELVTSPVSPASIFYKNGKMTYKIEL